MCNRCLNPRFQNQQRLIRRPYFFKEYHYPKVWINKILNEQNVIYLPSCSVSTSRAILSCLYRPLSVLSILRILVEFPVRSVFPIMIWDLRCSVYWLCVFADQIHGAIKIRKVSNAFHSSKSKEFPNSLLIFSLCFWVLGLL